MGNQAGGDEFSLSILYIHLYANGAIYFLPDDTGVSMEGDLSRLKAELSRLKDFDQAVVNFTTDPVEDDPTAEFYETALTLIDEFGIPSQALMYPHPEVYGFYKSYVPYILDAVQVAEIDVDGSERMIANAREALSHSDQGTEEYSGIVEDLAALEKQFEDAKAAYQRLQEIELELCAEPLGDGEH